MTASRAKGYDMGLLAILEKPDDLSVYAEHPSHQVYVNDFIICYFLSFSFIFLSVFFVANLILTYLGRVKNLREEICEDGLAYDMEF